MSRRISRTGDQRPRPPSLGRQSGTTSAAALVAVASGLLLDVVVVASFGAGGATDAFVVAARLPLMMTAVLLAVGNQALVPAFTTWLANLGRDAAGRLAGGVLAAGVGAGLVVALVLALLAVPVAAALAPGFSADQRAVTVDLARVMVLVVPLGAASEIYRAWLNAQGRFVLPALMTAVLNLVATIVVLAANGDIRVVPWAYLAGAAVQAVVMTVWSVHRGLRPSLRPPLRHPEVVATLRLCTRPTASAALNPLVRTVETLAGSFLPAGSVTILHYGNRLVSAVGGTVLFRSVMVALLPRLTRATAAGDAEARNRLTRQGIHLMVTISLPLTALGVALAVPAAAVVFAVGRFTADDAALLGLTLTVLAAGFPGSALQRAFLAPCYAALDTRTPWRNTLYGAIVNIALILVVALGLGSRAGGDAVLWLAGAAVLTQYGQAAHAARRMATLHPTPLRPLLGPAARQLFAATLGGALAAGITAGTGGYQPAPDRLPTSIWLAVATTAALVAVGTLHFGARRKSRETPRSSWPEGSSCAPSTAASPDSVASCSPPSSPRSPRTPPSP